MGDGPVPQEQYIRPTQVIDSDNKDVIRFAEDAVDKNSDSVEQAQQLFYAVRDGIAYDLRTPFFLPEHYRASNVLHRGRGYCVSKACLLCAMGRARGIPSRLGFADIRNYGASPQVVEMMGTNIFTFHGFVEFHLDGKWVKATPAFDSSIFKMHHIDPVDFDGSHDAVFPSHNLQGDPYVEYVTYHGFFDDLPLDALLDSWRKHYGEARVGLWMQLFVANDSS